MPKAKKPGNVNRLLNPQWGSARGSAWKLWDRDGRLWTLANDELDRERTEKLFFDKAVPVAVAEGTKGMTWIEPSDRRARWQAEVEERTFSEVWTWETKKAMPFTAMEFRRDSDALLLFYDND